MTALPILWAMNASIVNFHGVRDEVSDVDQRRPLGARRR
jgi:hypothetical protein